MQIPMEIFVAILTLIGGGMITGLAFIFKTLGKQNEALAVLVARVGTNDISQISARVLANETDIARIWGIYDACKGANSPRVQERLAGRV